jgi:hypothetical protein
LSVLSRVPPFVPARRYASSLPMASAASYGTRWSTAALIERRVAVSRCRLVPQRVSGVVGLASGAAALVSCGFDEAVDLAVSAFDVGA